MSPAHDPNSPIGPPRETGKMYRRVLHFSIHGRKLYKMGRAFSANPDLADILGDVDLDMIILIFICFFESNILDVQFTRFPKIGPGRA